MYDPSFGKMVKNGRFFEFLKLLKMVSKAPKWSYMVKIVFQTLFGTVFDRF